MNDANLKKTLIEIIHMFFLREFFTANCSVARTEQARRWPFLYRRAPGVQYEMAKSKPISLYRRGQVDG